MKHISFILIAISLASCQLVVEVDVPSGPQKLVVNSVFTPDSAWLVTVGVSSHILSEQFNPFPPKSSLALRDNAGRQIQLVELAFDDPQKRWYQNAGGAHYGSTEHPLPGVTYTLEVTAPDFSPVIVTANAPSEIEFFEAKLDSAAMVQEDEVNGTFPLEVTFADPPGQEDYYYPFMWIEQELSHYDPQRGDTVWDSYKVIVWLERSDAENVFDFEGDEREAISDAAFDGKVRTERWRVQLPIKELPGRRTKRLWFVLVHTGPEYFKYYKSMRLQQNTRGNPLAQPVQVYSNIEGGLGIFAGFTVNTWEFIK